MHGHLTITDENGIVIYDSDADVGLTPMTPSLEVARDGSSYNHWVPWGRAFWYRITVDTDEL